MNISEQLIKDLIHQGVDTFFGIQGGACARLIDNVIKYKGKFIPVLNEQSAGFYAHGYYMSTKKTPGLIFTTGPGLTNGITGIAACYYDRVPLVVLVGQVVRNLNIAKKTNTRMVGFQEVPHLDLCKSISDNVFKIDHKNKYRILRKKFLKNVSSKVQVVEFLDDIQRVKIKKKYSNQKYYLNSKNVSLSIEKKKLIKNSIKPVFIVGAGLAQSTNLKKSIKKLVQTNICIACTWGGQKIQNYLTKKENFLGIMGNHNPGVANKYIKGADLIIAVGCSLLQHQVGKHPRNFAKLAKILYVNNDINECKRARKQFGKRLSYINGDATSFLSQIPNKNKKPYIQDKADNKAFYPSNLLKYIFEKINKNSIIFADAGATLSWTYQAANMTQRCPPIFTSFNLHSMGYANCAAIGASISQRKNVYCVIGDGSIPMNGQELSWISKFPFKMIILDNRGYGIIRQTQRSFYKSKFYGSDFKNNKSKLPKFSLEKILNSYAIKFKKIKNKPNKKDFLWFNSSNTPKALIIDVNYNAQVITE